MTYESHGVSTVDPRLQEHCGLTYWIWQTNDGRFQYCYSFNNANGFVLELKTGKIACVMNIDNPRSVITIGVPKLYSGIEPYQGVIY